MTKDIEDEASRQEEKKITEKIHGCREAGPPECMTAMTARVR